jgi:hypothetical protein
MKYFVKYKEWTAGRESVAFDKTRFFNTHDIEQEWASFKRLNSLPVSLVDITPLPRNGV